MIPMQEKTSTRPVGYLFSNAGLLAMIVGLVTAVWFQAPLIVMLFCLILSTVLLARLWSRVSLVGVRYEQQLGAGRVFFGEQVDLRLELANDKILPMPWVWVDVAVPRRLARAAVMAGQSAAAEPSLRKAASLKAYGQVTWKQTFFCRKRGYYAIGPAGVTSGDLFAFYPRRLTKEMVSHLSVYPRLLPLHDPGMLPLYPLIEAAAKRRIFEDPTRIVGMRDYRPGDNIRHIHWKVTARSGELKTKVFEPTTALEAAIFLAVDTFGDAPEDDDRIFETAVSVVASSAKAIEERGGQVGVFVNSRLMDSGQPAVIPPGRGIGQLTLILETLARVTKQASCPFEDFWEREQKHVSEATMLIFVVSGTDASGWFPEIFRSLAARGFKFHVASLEKGRGEEVRTVVNGMTTDTAVRQPSLAAGGTG